MSDVAAQRALERVEGDPPFVADPFGFDAFSSALRELQEFIGGLYLTDPVLFWVVMISLTAVAAGMALHIVWSIWVLYRAMKASAPVVEGARAPRDLESEVRAAMVASDHRRAVELAWLALCVRFDVPLSDTPRVQLRRLDRSIQSTAKLEELLHLRERAAYAARAPNREEADTALRLAREFGA
ncbi:MAG: hypothetical protein AAF658_05400 [Myxococcota bacterium]